MRAEDRRRLRSLLRYGGTLAASFLGLIAPVCSWAAPPEAGSAPTSSCRVAVLEGQVEAGQGYEKTFTRGLVFMLEPLRSGWIVRVLAANEPRGPHDFAELATPPYESVSPLLISTDWSFRAQDAVAWNPRRFQYAKDKAALNMLTGLQPGVLANDVTSMGKLAAELAPQPEGTLRILDARIAPGTADQGKMAAAVALHLANTPYVVDRAAAPSVLGRIEMLRFRVELTLPTGSHAMTGVHEQPCANQPTAGVSAASQRTSSRMQAR